MKGPTRLVFWERCFGPLTSFAAKILAAHTRGGSAEVCNHPDRCQSSSGW